MPTPDLAAWVLTLAVAIGGVSALIRNRQDVALGIIAIAGSLSMITAPIGDLDIRLEQPAVVALALILVARDRNSIAKVLRAGRWPIVLLGIYLAANAISATFVAPDPVHSLRLVAWMGLSLIAFGVAAVLVGGSTRAGSDLGFGVWLVAAACLHSVVAILQVIAELLTNSAWGVLSSDVPIGKTFGLAWEPNLLAITLAVAAIFVIEPSYAKRFRPIVLLLARLFIAVGMALALSRGGIVALIAGVGVLAVGMARMVTARWTPGDRWAFIRSATMMVLISVVGYAALGTLATASGGPRPADWGGLEAGEGPLIPAGQEPSGASASARATPTPSKTATASDRPVQPPVFVGTAETIALRLRNLVVAVEDALSSPLVGLGPGAFGQRYTEPTCSCPAHIPNQLAGTLFESGFLGLLSLGCALFWIGRRAWRVGAPAHLAALATLLVGYQFTDALRFGSSWLLIGVLLGLVVARSHPKNPERTQPPRATR
jgi:hypothetical protein